MSNDVLIEPFIVAVDEEVLDDLRERIRQTRWPAQALAPGWDRGTDTAYLRDLLATWANGFDWRARERWLNGFAHFRATVDGTGIHFIHERGTGPAPLPIVLTHGWPSTFTEHLDLIPLLTDPAAHGGDPADAFDVVVTSLPGYGFSDPPAGPGMTRSDTADLWHRLMRDGLGYRRFGVHGTDIGAGVSTRLAQRHPDAVSGVHLSALSFPMPAEPWTLAEQDYLAVVNKWRQDEGGYAHMHGTKPQTLAHALNDSPAGLAAWIIEKFRSWSDCGGDVESRFTRDQLLTNLTIYWATSTIGPSMVPYYESLHADSPLPPGGVTVPSGFAVFPNELRTMGHAPRELAARFYNVTHWTEHKRGGHFPALEEPAALAQDIRDFFRPLR